MKIRLDYHELTISITDNNHLVLSIDCKHDFCQQRNRKTPNGDKIIYCHDAKKWLLAIFHYSVYRYITDKKNEYITITEDFKKYSDEYYKLCYMDIDEEDKDQYTFKYAGSISRTVTSLNMYFEDRYQFALYDIKSERKYNAYKLSDSFIKNFLYPNSNHTLEFREYNDKSLFEKYNIKKEWQVKQSDEDALKGILHSEPSKVVAGKDIFKWNNKKVARVAELYINTFSDIKPELIPKVSVGEEVYQSLRSFIEVPLSRSSRYSDCNVAFVEGESGTGKTYSLIDFLRCEGGKGAKVRCIYIKAFFIFDNEGDNTLLSYLARYMDKPDIQIGVEDCRSLIKAVLEQSTDCKTYIIIDNVDEIAASRYDGLIKDVKEIVGIGNPNIYCIIASKNTSPLIKEMNNMKYVQAKTKYLESDTIKDGDLKILLDDHPEMHTPLVRSYYEEIKKNKGKTDSINIANYAEFKINHGIRNYYDLYNVRLAVMANNPVRYNSKEAVKPIVYKTIIPAIAYFLYKFKEGNPDFDDSFVEFIFKTIVESNEYREECQSIKNEYFAFLSLSSKDKMKRVCTTGIVLTVEGGSHYIFKHIDYMLFLASVFAVNKLTSNVFIDNSIMNEVLLRTSCFDDNILNKDTDKKDTDKMRLLPYGYYLFMGLLETGKKIDRDMFLLGAYVAYEETVDLYDELLNYIDCVLQYWMDKIGSVESRKNNGFEDARVISLVNSLLYIETSSKRHKDKERLEMLKGLMDRHISFAKLVIYRLLSSVKMVEGFSDDVQNDVDLLLNVIDSNPHSFDHLHKNGKWEPESVDLVGKALSNLGNINLSLYKVILEKPYLNTAEQYHKLSLKYRNNMKKVFDDHTEINCVGSLKGLATDNYYKKHYKEAIVFLEEALELQGVDSSKIAQWEIDKPIPDSDRLPVEEEPHAGNEAYETLLLNAGNYFNVWDSDGQDDNSLIMEQYKYLKAAYMYFREGCSDKEQFGEWDRGKMQQHLKFVDDRLWKDVNDKYFNSFSKIPDSMHVEKDGCIVLLKKILECYKVLHPYYSVKGIDTSVKPYRIIKS